MKPRFFRNGLEYMGRSMITVAESWPLPARTQAHQLVDEYGMPDVEAMDSLAWEPANPWQRVRVRSDGLIEETVPYEVPNERIGRVDAFGGRLFIDRFHKEVTAISQSEEMNCLILNLMHDLVIGTRTHGQAWEKFQRVQQTLTWNCPDPYACELHFHTDTYQFERQKSFPPQVKRAADETFIRPHERHPYSR